MDVKIIIPSPGESITEVVLESWLVDDGEFVKKGQELCEVESEKATLSIPAEASGIVSLKAAEGDVLNVGDVACLITVSETERAFPASPEKSASSLTLEDKEADEIEEKISPLSDEKPRQFSKEKKETDRQQAPQKMERPTLNTDEKNVGGQISKVVNEEAVETIEPRGEERKKLSPLRKKIAQRLVAVRNETAMLTTFNEINMGRVKEIRSRYQDEFVEKHGVKLGYMSFFIKAICLAMKDFPGINSMIDGDEVVHFNYVDMGISVSAPKGLVVPVIRNAEQLNLWDLEKEIKRLAEKARGLSLSIDEMSGGTFTITNGGIFGSLLSTPIINPPQSAILGMHNILDRPIAVDGKVEIHPMMYVALSYDHRIVDGRESVSFLYKVKELIEDPMRLMLEV